MKNRKWVALRERWEADRERDRKQIREGSATVFCITGCSHSTTIQKSTKSFQKIERRS